MYARDLAPRHIGKLIHFKTTRGEKLTGRLAVINYSATDGVILHLTAGVGHHVRNDLTVELIEDAPALVEQKHAGANALPGDGTTEVTYIGGMRHTKMYDADGKLTAEACEPENAEPTMRPIPRIAVIGDGETCAKRHEVSTPEDPAARERLREATTYRQAPHVHYGVVSTLPKSERTVGDKVHDALAAVWEAMPQIIGLGAICTIAGSGVVWILRSIGWF